MLLVGSALGRIRARAEPLGQLLSVARGPPRCLGLSHLCMAFPRETAALQPTQTPPWLRECDILRVTHTRATFVQPWGVPAPVSHPVLMLPAPQPSPHPCKAWPRPAGVRATAAAGERLYPAQGRATAPTAVHACAAHASASTNGPRVCTRGPPSCTRTNRFPRVRVHVHPRTPHPPPHHQGAQHPCAHHIHAWVGSPPRAQTPPPPPSKRCSIPGGHLLPLPRTPLPGVAATGGG